MSAISRFGCLAILWGAVVGVGTAAAQSKTGTTTAVFLGIEPSARTAAMGNAGVALREGIEAVYFNAGAIGRLHRKTLLFTHSPWYADINYNYAAGALPVGDWGTLFASLTALNSGEIDVRTVQQPLGTGERYSASDVAIGLGFGRQVTDRFSTGFQFNYVSQRIWHTSQSLVTFNIGTVYEVASNGLAIGSGISNAGTSARYTGQDLAIQFDDNPSVYGDNSALPGQQSTDAFGVPLLFRVGLSYPYELGPRSHLLLMVDALHPNDNAESVNFGAEWSWQDALALRGGYQTLFQDDSDLAWTVGVGLKRNVGENRFRFDYAWADHARLDETHRFTLVLEL
jgi:hypothetical protein